MIQIKKGSIFQPSLAELYFLWSLLTINYIFFNQCITLCLSYCRIYSWKVIMFLWKNKLKNI